MTYQLRNIREDDMQLLFDWANDDEVRSNAINTNKIVLQDHEAWFKKRLNASTCYIFILEKNEQPVAQARFDFNEEEHSWEIDYSVAKAYRGQGLGKVVLEEAISKFNRYPLTAYVKPANLPSVKIFQSLNFQQQGEAVKHNTTLLKYIKKRA